MIKKPKGILVSNSFEPWLEEEVGFLAQVDYNLNCAQDQRHGSESGVG